MHGGAQIRRTKRTRNGNYKHGRFQEIAGRIGCANLADGGAIMSLRRVGHRERLADAIADCEGAGEEKAVVISRVGCATVNRQRLAGHECRGVK